MFIDDPSQRPLLIITQETNKAVALFTLANQTNRITLNFTVAECFTINEAHNRAVLFAVPPLWVFLLSH